MQVFHECAWGCQGSFLPSRYNSSRAKCIKCSICGLFFSPNKFVFHSHPTSPNAKYVQPDAANFNSWRRHIRLSGEPLEKVTHAWEDVKAMFNGGTRKRILSSGGAPTPSAPDLSAAPKKSCPPKVPDNRASPTAQFSLPVLSSGSRVPALPLVMDYMLQHHTTLLKGNTFGGSYPPFPWLPSAKLGFGLPPSTAPFFFPKYDSTSRLSAFRPVYPTAPPSPKDCGKPETMDDDEEEETVDIETCHEEEPKAVWQIHRPD